MKVCKKLFMAGIAGALSIPLQAEQIQNANVASLTTDISRNEVSFSMVGNGGGCDYDVIRFSLSTEGGKAAYSQLLAAKTAGTAVRYVQYTNTDGYCILTIVSS
jgi:hypothetical protein